MVFGIKCINTKNGVHEVLIYNTKDEAERAYHVLSHDGDYIAKRGLTAYLDTLQNDVYDSALSILERVEQKQFATPVMVDIRFSIGGNPHEMYRDDITIINDRSVTIH